MGGYEELELQPGQWRLLYSGNQHLGSLGTEAAFLRRAAELSKAADYDYFVVTQEQDLITTRTISAGPNVVSTQVQPTLTGFNAVSTIERDEPTTSQGYVRKGMIKGYKEGTQPKGAYKSTVILDKYKD